jgi:hypothetical protein
MTDHTSDDLLKQPEPESLADDGERTTFPIQDDPIVNRELGASLAAHFAAEAEAGAPVSMSAPARPQEIAEKAADLREQTPNPSPLETELAQVKRELALLKLAPQERYPEVLKDAEITLEEAHQILDCVVIQLKPWVEKMQVTKSLYITFQTRGMQDQRRLDRWAEETRPQLDTTVVAEALINNMAASLVAYGDEAFGDEDTKEEDRYQAAYDKLAMMPYPAYRLVQTALAKFDAKINAVFSEGYLENF